MDVRTCALPTRGRVSLAGAAHSLRPGEGSQPRPHATPRRADLRSLEPRLSSATLLVPPSLRTSTTHGFPRETSCKKLVALQCASHHELRGARDPALAGRPSYPFGVMRAAVPTRARRRRPVRSGNRPAAPPNPDH